MIVLPASWRIVNDDDDDNDVDDVAYSLDIMNKRIELAICSYWVQHVPPVFTVR